ncbi:WD40 repeat-like protein [Hypoxylon fragiforme]|uniref:WD40 repeat-like protein n=1 Tax=Hypoxylon fragiforme TaxID=63214 RepID=UPI0020C63E3F|nr:WD40 repeat-like protein [Hypoxylon fragiforme]KAI2614216.1 WD40 repeat-like protein [Hypoxylon fragiforme]
MSQHQSAEPAKPKSVLRGHRTQVHATAFIRSNHRLATGDADGFVVIWDLTIMRPRAVWRAHTNAILTVADWGDNRIITHGRDNRLVVWKLALEDESAMSTALPLDESAPERTRPWILHILEVNTMNFCSFASCAIRSDNSLDELLIAVPNTLETEAIDIFHLPSQDRRYTIHLGSKTEQKGMVMSLSLFLCGEHLTLAAAYESGLAIVARLGENETWDILYRAQVHSQPVLSLDVAPQKDFFLTSGADAIIAKHPIPPPCPLARESQQSRQANRKNTEAANSSLSSAAISPESSPAIPIPIPPRQSNLIIETQPLKTINTKHSGQQGLRIRSDGKIFATAGWDSKVRVYSIKTMTELAVLKWHEVGCYATAFATLADKQSSNLVTPNTHRNKSKDGAATTGNIDNEGTTLTALPKPGQLSVKDRRINMAREAHWLAAGSKDGKISLWDIY